MAITLVFIKLILVIVCKNDSEIHERGDIVKNLHEKLLEHTSMGKECVILTALDSSAGIVLDKVLLTKNELHKVYFSYDFECIPQLIEKIRQKGEMALTLGSYLRSISRPQGPLTQLAKR